MEDRNLQLNTSVALSAIKRVCSRFYLLNDCSEKVADAKTEIRNSVGTGEKIDVNASVGSWINALNKSEEHHGHRDLV